MHDLVGVDGCRGGWLAVVLPGGDVRRAHARIMSRAADLWGLGAPIAIDMPVGLMDRPADGARPADAAARRFLAAHNFDGHRGVGARVFGLPTRAHLDILRKGGDYAALRAAFPSPNALSKQSWNICAKIAELDDLLRRCPAAPFWEAHPEVAFAHHAGRTLAPKKTGLGAQARRELLDRAGFAVNTLSQSLPPSRAAWAEDDLFDACILALTAGRIAAGVHAGLPSLDERDSRGLRRAIHY
ncbi:MAG: DUF429 domain-containing protein [Pseudomonadota bacterium]